MDYKVVEASKVLSKLETYKMIVSDANISLGKDCEGLVLTPEVWVLYETTDKTGKAIEVLSIMDGKDVYSTISETFKRHFFDILATFGEEVVPIVVIYGTSKNGRQFVTCNVA